MGNIDIASCKDGIYTNSDVVRGLGFGSFQSWIHELKWALAGAMRVEN
jgi:hypothetical protein